MTNFSKLTIIALTFSLIFISCKDSSITSSQESEIQTSEIGYYHNQALDFVFDNKNVDPSTLDYSELRDIITERLADKYPTKFNHKLFVENKLAINKGLTKSGFLKFENPPKNLKNLNDSNPEFSGDYNSFISYLKENNHISQTLYSRLMKLYNNKKSWLSKGDPVEFAKSEVSVETLPNSDKKFANAFLSTLEASDQYWNKKSKSNSINKGKKAEPCDVAPIVADGAGGLYGMIAGPVSATVIGTIASAQTVISCEYHSDDEE